MATRTSLLQSLDVLHVGADGPNAANMGRAKLRKRAPNMNQIAPSKFSRLCTEAQAELRDSSPERQTLFYLLETYWGDGDGAAPPKFITQAAALCGYPLNGASV